MASATPTMLVHHQRATIEWLARAIEHGHGGVCAYFAPGVGWSEAYPEATGELIPMLLRIDARHGDLALKQRALELGRWLLAIQNSDGSWNGGLHPLPGLPRPRVFSTGQVVAGLIALHRAGCGKEFLVAAARGAAWLVVGQDARGLWPFVDYRASETPSYYTQVFAAMFETWLETGDARVRAGAEAGLQSVLERVRDDGLIERWGFSDESNASTHTIAGTLCGLLECSRILDAWDDIGARTRPALKILLKQAESRGGRLAGEFDERFNPRGAFECLTGAAQTAINLLAWEREENDARLVDGAAKLVERVCATQHLRHPLAGIRGAVAGSAPIWGRYMALRFPSWAAKHHCDALDLLGARRADTLPFGTQAAFVPPLTPLRAAT